MFHFGDTMGCHGYICGMSVTNTVPTAEEWAENRERIVSALPLLYGARVEEYICKKYPNFFNSFSKNNQYYIRNVKKGSFYSPVVVEGILVVIEHHARWMEFLEGLEVDFDKVKFTNQA